MSDERLLFRGGRVLLVAACLVIVIVGLREAAAILRPFLAAIFLTILSLPLLSTFKRLRCSNAFSVLLTMSALIAFIVGIGFLVGGSFRDFTDSLPIYQQGLDDVTARFLDWLEARGVPAKDYVSEQPLAPGAVLDLVGGTLRRLALIVSNAALVLIITLFLLAEVASFPEKFEAAMGPSSGAMNRLARGIPSRPISSIE